MELPEKISDINYWLERDYGKTGLHSNWRVVWADDQYETVKGVFSHYDENGRLLSTQAGVAQVRKYEYIHEKFVLERIMPVGMLNRDELVGNEWSYEPVFTFEDGNGNFLPPLKDVCKLVIEQVLKMAAKAVGARYKNPEDGHDPLEVKAERVKKLQEELFGNETDTTDLLHAHEGVVVPQNYEKGKVH